jgi:hypothetical protein
VTFKIHGLPLSGILSVTKQAIKGNAQKFNKPNLQKEEAEERERAAKPAKKKGLLKTH